MNTDLLGQLTMQQAVMRIFPTATAKVQFTNRSENMTFTKECTETLKEAVASERLKSLRRHSPHKVLELADLQLTAEERSWLRQQCPYLEEDYLDYLQVKHSGLALWNRTYIIPGELSLQAGASHNYIYPDGGGPK
jgi:nicotinate phosphoribosyltransferase